MNEKLILILFLFSFVNLSGLKHSDEIWEKFKDYQNQGKAKIESTDYFIFDESNYLSDDINSSKMISFYTLQYNYFYNYGIKNYFFVIDTLDYESLETFTDNLYTYISKEITYSLSNSVIIVIAILDKKIRIKTGTQSNAKYADEYIDTIINNIGPYMRSSNYYGGCVNIIQDLEKYYGKEYQSGSSGTSISTIFIAIFVIIGIIAFCCLICYCNSKGYCETSGSSYHSYGHHHHHHYHSSGGHRSGGGGGGHRSGGGHHSGGRSGGW